MSLRRRIVLVSAAAVALAVALSTIAAYLAVDHSLRNRIDRQLRTVAGNIAAVSQRPVTDSQRLARLRSSPGFDLRRLPHPGLQSTGVVALFDSRGAVYRSPADKTSFRLTARDLAVARGTGAAYFRDTQVKGLEVRVYVRSAAKGQAVIAEQSLSELHSTLHQLALILGVIALAGVLLAGFLGMLVARAGSSPVHALRRAAEHVRLTGDLSRRIEAVGDDDLGQLGRSFNTMLAALEESQRAQQQLIADASHELRTPISTLRTNLEVLIRNPDLDPTEREPLLEDLVAEMRELGDLVDDLLESARTYDAQIGMAPVQMADLVRMEIGRLQARHPESDVSADLHPCEVHGDERRLRRAVANILENAVKWSPPGEPIEVALAEGELDVRDHGPGFFVEDLPHVFDRFYRSPVARGVPGSGLGLSIVRKVATEHGGAAEAMNAVGGGALVRLRLPCAPTARHLIPAGQL